jgi:hypothetical protein
MDEELIRITPNKEKAESILKMVDNTLNMIGEIDESRFPSNLAKEYYDVIRELAGIIMLLDGYKIRGEKAHKRLFEYISRNYVEFNDSEIALMDELRVLRNRIAYDGFFVKDDYIKRKKGMVLELIEKLKNVIESRF